MNLSNITTSATEINRGNKRGSATRHTTRLSTPMTARDHGNRHANMLINDLDANATNTIIEARHVSQSFTNDKGNKFIVLDDISLAIHHGEIIAILGRSGAGKSTLLRILAGLIEPDKGTVNYRGNPVTGVNPGVALVFQTFALMPWLSVQANVELGLEARGIPRKERAELALGAIDAIGLDGFESAYPKELSGGMRQRVSIAHALVLHPDSLFMDEPFSALDVLTAENPRQEVLKLCHDDNRSISSMLLVTHNIEEAVQMADRVVVMGSHPGHLIAQVPVNLPRPRDKHTAAFEETVDELYTILTGRDHHDTTDTKPEKDLEHHPQFARPQSSATISSRTNGNAEDLPNATPGGLAGLLNVVAGYDDGVDLSDLAADLSFEVDDLFPLLDAETMLDILHIAEGHITVTDAGQTWNGADILEAKQVFAKLVMQHAPLVSTIDHALHNRKGTKLHGELILDLLRNRRTDEEAQQQFNIAISWGRYGELFDYDADDDLLTLDEANISAEVRLND